VTACVSVLTPAVGGWPAAAGRDRGLGPPQPGAAIRRLDALVGRLHDAGLFDGAVVVGKGREVVWARGVGDANRERQVPFTADTAVDGGSLAKTFTAALVLQLRAEGRLELDAPVQRWLPELPYPAITWRHLLSHSSGLPVLDYDYFDGWLPANQVRTIESLLGVLATQRPALAFAPGSAFEYSSFGYDLAALAAARVERSTFAGVLQMRILDPLGLTSAFVRPARLFDFRGTRTRGYRRAGDALVPNDVFDYEAFHGGSNVYISARDLHVWNASFVDGPTISRAALQAALQPARIGAAESRLTLGSWYRSEDATAFWYSGHLQGFHSEVFRDLRAGWSVVYVSNNTLAPWLQKALVRAIRSILAGADVAPPAPPPTVALSREQHSRLAGRWQLSDGERLSIERAGDHLAFHRHGVAYRMVPVDPRTFYVPGADVMVGFAGQGGGPPARIHVASNVDERWGARER
jgi:CubicO group peptidase (beta-lactamase class C family)